MRPITIPAHNPGPYTGAGTNTYFLPGQVPVLIDAGTGHPRHLDDLGDALSSSGTGALGSVLVTHNHPDHASGAPALRSRWPAATFAKWPDPADAAGGIAWQPLHDDQLVPAGDAALWVLHTPGHAPDHVCFFEPHSGLLFAGDLVVNGGTVFVPASHGGSVAQYLASLRRVLELQPRRIMPGHGAPIDHPGALLRGYIAHRLTRERQILDVLARGPRDVPGLVEDIYKGLADGLLAAAGESVLAHLIKLRDEGRATAEPDEAGREVWRIQSG
jgi:glyoxylase-like metal-dependent hydrolase (beta-lactamase superfamily II)